ncbi:MAG TPA: hypothetical protein VHE30_07425 [Polyangiaceae bacterium]|nr:hypothetical protein [Polyangiaceae bacterium]
MTGRRGGRTLTVLALSLVGGAVRAEGAPPSGPAAPPPVAVTASCEHRQTKGRVLCDVELEAANGRLAWADVLVVRAPPFAAPLRARVQGSDARVRTEQRIRISVAFVATSLGKGTVALRARAVLCTKTGESETCVPRTEDAEAELSVGTDVVR